MNENIDLTKILKDVPKGTKLYSTIYGVVEFDKINASGSRYPIVFYIPTLDKKASVTKDGRHLDVPPGECTLFPSADQRDWSKFEVLKKQVKVTLHPFDKVLRRDEDEDHWLPDHLSYIDESDDCSYYRYVTFISRYTQCIPYTPETAHLLNTSNSPDVEYEIEFDKSFKE